MEKKKIAIIACLVGFITTLAGLTMSRVLPEFFAREESSAVIQLMQSPTLMFISVGMMLGFGVVCLQKKNSDSE